MLSVVLVLAALSDSPRAVNLTPQTGVMPVVIAAQGDLPQSLTDARKLADQLRYEESVVEYQRYLTVADRPVRERALALLELGFIHLVLGDDKTAEERALQSLEVDPTLELSSGAPARQLDFFNKLKKQFLTRAQLTVQPRQNDDAAPLVRVSLKDPEGKVKRVLLRHALSPQGPFHSTEMNCAGDQCSAVIPPPKDANNYSAWYFIEALGEDRLTLARAAGSDSPLQLSVVGGKPWYQSPLVWGIGGAAVVAVTTVVFLLAPQPPR